MNIENTQNNQDNEEEIAEVSEKTFAQKVTESVDFIVDMMNRGKANPKDVYPPGRYQGD
jgi:hypothetical protein